MLSPFDPASVEIDMKAVLEASSTVHVTIPSHLPPEETAKFIRSVAPEVAHAVIAQEIVEARAPTLKEAKFQGDAIMRGALPAGKA